ncbi:MAG: Heparinase II/III-like protein [Bacteroidales bacterium]|nr:Heparinase II/III-like protein [Bacteroidales bacterium]
MTERIMLISAFVCLGLLSACTPNEYGEILKPDPVPVYAEDDDDMSEDQPGLFDYSLLSKTSHPRLFLTTEDFEELKGKVADGSNPWLKKTSDHIIGNAEEYLEDASHIRYILDASGVRLLTQSRLALKRLWAYSYAYKVGGDRKFLAAALADLSTVCSFKDWHPSHYLDVAEMAFGVSIAYDWLYDEIPAGLRKQVRNALKEYALKTFPAQNYFRGTNTNWNQVCVCSLVSAAIVLYEKDKELCRTTIEEGVASNAAAMAEIYGRDGNYPEGYSYWGYGTTYQVMLLQMLEKAFGHCNGMDTQEGFSHTAEYMLYMLGPDAKPFPYADGGSSDQDAQEAMWWFAAHQDNASLLINEINMFESPEGYGTGRLLPFIPCVLKDFPVGNGKLLAPQKEIWVGGGSVPVAMVHTSWRLDDSDSYVGIKAGAASHSHGHQDAGSFIYVADGVRWIKDFVRPSYDSIESKMAAVSGNLFDMTQSSFRWDVTKLNNLTHSTISCFNSDGSISGKVHVSDHIVNGAVTIDEVFDTPEKLGVRLDMTAPLADAVARAERTVVLVGRKTLQITDVITAKGGMDARIEWRALTAATATITTGEISLKRSGKMMYMRTVSSNSHPFAYTIWPTTRRTDWTPRDWDENPTENMIGFSSTIPAGHTVSFTTTFSQD